MKKQLTYILISVFLVHLADYIYIPILPILLNTKQKLSFRQIGLLIGIGSICYQFSSLISGFLSDKIGRKLVLFIGVIITTVSLIFYGLSKSYHFLIIFEILKGLGSGVFPPTLKALISELDDVDKTLAFSKRGIVANLGVAIGGLVPLLFAKLSFPIYFISSSIIYGLITIFIFKLPNTKKNNNHLPFKELSKNRRFILLNILAFIIWALYIQLRVILPLKGKSFLVNLSIISIIFSITSVFVIIAQRFITRRIIKKTSYLNSLSIGVIAFGIGLLLMGQAKSFSLLLFSSLIFIIGEMFIAPSLDALTSKLADEKMTGAYYSISHLSFGLGSAFGSWLSGELMQHFGINNILPWLILFIMAIITSIIIRLAKSKLTI
ncbi:MAG: MFS transporter [Bacilli bacterium]|nr:MFS transporter [Bacilli bacterium]